MISSDDKVILIFIAIVFGIGWVGFQLGVQTTEQRIDNELRICLEEKAELEVEKENIKQDVANLLKDFYGKQLVWDVLGIKRYTRALCGINIYLDIEIPDLEELIC